MKKLVTIILILALLLPAAAFAASHVKEAYVLFIDAYTFNQALDTGFDFDSMIFDLILMSDGKTAYFSKQTWKDGIRTTTDVVECGFSSDSENFVLSFPDGTKFKGYYDPREMGVWVNLGGDAYFRFPQVHHYAPVDDYTVK